MKLLQLILTGGRECDIAGNNDDHQAPEPGHGGSAESSIVQSILSISTGPVSRRERLETNYRGPHLASTSVSNIITDHYHLHIKTSASLNHVKTQ